MKNLIFICLVLISFKACGQASITKNSKGIYVDIPKDSTYYSKDCFFAGTYDNKGKIVQLFKTLDKKNGGFKYFFISQNPQGVWGRKYRKVV